MKKYTYQRVKLESSTYEPDDAVIAALNAYGQQGWRCESMLLSNSKVYTITCLLEKVDE